MKIVGGHVLRAQITASRMQWWRRCVFLSTALAVLPSYTALTDVRCPVPFFFLHFIQYSRHEVSRIQNGTPLSSYFLEIFVLYFWKMKMITWCLFSFININETECSRWEWIFCLWIKLFSSWCTVGTFVYLLLVGVECNLLLKRDHLSLRLKRNDITLSSSKHIGNSTLF